MFVLGVLGPYIVLHAFVALQDKIFMPSLSALCYPIWVWSGCGISYCIGRPCGLELIAAARIAVPGNDGIWHVYRQCLCDVGYDIEPTSSILSSIGQKIGLLMCDRAILMCDRENSDCPNFHVGKFGLSEFALSVDIVFIICTFDGFLSLLFCAA